MILEVALIIIICVLFIQMGLSDAIQRIFKVKLVILSCPKCLTFWSVLTYCIIMHFGIINCLATSFISSYISLWLVLLYDIIAVKYNKYYEDINQEGSDT